MIDEKALEEILALKKERQELIEGLKYTDGCGGMCRIDFEYDKSVNVDFRKLYDFFGEHIERLDEKLTSLGFQPSPLDLKEGENK